MMIPSNINTFRPGCVLISAHQNFTGIIIQDSVCNIAQILHMLMKIQGIVCLIVLQSTLWMILIFVQVHAHLHIIETLQLSNVSSNVQPIHKLITKLSQLMIEGVILTVQMDNIEISLAFLV